MDLPTLARFLSTHPAVAEKAAFQQEYEHALEVSGNIRLGDDCAVLPNPAGSGYLLFAAEGMPQAIVEHDPWFAGYSAIMLNLSDIAAMGGRPVALADILWSPSDEISSQIWQGMQAAARAYGVPIVGGHTTHTGSRDGAGNAALGAAVIGHAGDRLITSFDAKPGDHLVIVIDMHGGYRGNGGDGSDGLDGRDGVIPAFWDSSATSSPERLRAGLEMLPALAEKGLCRAGKNISTGGIIGTLATLCHGSEVGVILDLEDLPCPMDVEIERWLVSVPSYGYLLAISQGDLESTLSHFTATRITCREIGHFRALPGITITADGDAADLIFSQPGTHATLNDFTMDDLIHIG
jgi:selenophosphate synthetase-related protein